MVPLLSTAIVALAGVLFIAGVIFGKMIAVETMAVVQITFFALLSLNQMNPSFAYLNSLKYANGYNSLFTNSNDTHLEDGLTSTNAKGIFLFSRFA